MRVIAGTARGRRLYVPRSEVRPTMDRVKAAIFSALGDNIIGARVLDLFAGTGALGIEALSRGCASVVFVEKDAPAADAIRRNLIATGLHGDVLKMDVFDYLKRRAGPGAFDVIFADPPYAKAPGEPDFGAMLVADEALRRTAAGGAVFFLEKIPGQPLAAHDGWVLIRTRCYGATEVALLRRLDG